ncbi:MAG: DUF3179 domain-containing protein [Candidatus Manganitrophus sp. SA1]|nr:DUF3179 domain-containing protein [Candidatus Manganitrophus morganii]
MKLNPGGILLIVSLIFLMGFDFSKHSIPLDEILSGGPEKDGIPAILRPKFVPADQAEFLKRDDRVLALESNGEAKAYPIKILNWHEIVNDRIGGRPILITYCPLCGTGMAFDPVIEGKHYTFGVSGLLYKSDVLMYDHQTESLWSQIQQEAVTGPLTGTRLKLLPLVHTTWQAWQAEHPKTWVLSIDTGFRRDYTRDPYESYARSDRLIFPVGKGDDRLAPKVWVMGVILDEIARAYPFSELERGPSSFTDVIGSKRVTLSYDRPSRTARIRDNAGRELPAVVSYWFAWAAFHPKTEVYQHSPSRGGRP